MKTGSWTILLGILFILSLIGSFLVLRPRPEAARAQISSGGKIVKTVNLREDQQFTVTAENGGENLITVRDGKIAEEGTHSQLMEKGGIYYGMCNVNQAKIGI